MGGPIDRARALAAVAVKLVDAEDDERLRPRTKSLKYSGVLAPASRPRARARMGPQPDKADKAAPTVLWCRL